MISRGNYLIIGFKASPEFINIPLPCMAMLVFILDIFHTVELVTYYPYAISFPSRNRKPDIFTINC